MSTPSTSLTIGLIGCGRMGGAIARGLLRARPSIQLRVYDRNLAATQALADDAKTLAPTDPITVCHGPVDAASHTDATLLAVKPYGIVPLIKQLRDAPPTLLISIAAGLKAATLRAVAGSHRLVRTMPNTPALVGEGVTTVLIDDPVRDEDRTLVHTLFEPLGLVEEIEHEHLIDPMTALAGSGPAFVAMILEALADAAVVEGLPREMAYRLARQTLRGTAALAAEQHPGALKDAVGSPGGTTMAGVVAAEAAGLRHAIIAAVRAAAQHSRDMG